MSDVFSLLHELVTEVSDLRGTVASLESRLERQFRKGVVTDVDAKTQTYRQSIGLDDDGNPVKSPWVPYAQTAGALSTHSPPSVGQQMLLISPDGDHEQAHGMPLTFSDGNPSPSQDPGTDMSVRGKSSDTQTKDGRTFKVGTSSIAMIDGKIVLTADTIALVGNVFLGAEDASRELSLKGSIDSAGDTEQDNLATKVKGV